MNDHFWMSQALAQAQKAAKAGEVPMGAVAVLDNKKIASAYNKSISLNDPTAHAEILILRKVARKIKNYRLNGLTLYVTKEPCAMCKGSFVWARIARVVWGCSDLKPQNHKVHVTRGVLREESARVLQNFFKSKR